MGKSTIRNPNVGDWFDPQARYYMGGLSKPCFHCQERFILKCSESYFMCQTCVDAGLPKPGTEMNLPGIRTFEQMADDMDAKIAAIAEEQGL